MTIRILHLPEQPQFFQLKLRQRKKDEDINEARRALKKKYGKSARETVDPLARYNGKVSLSLSCAGANVSPVRATDARCRPRYTLSLSLSLSVYARSRGKLRSRSRCNACVGVAPLSMPRSRRRDTDAQRACVRENATDTEARMHRIALAMPR